MTHPKILTSKLICDQYPHNPFLQDVISDTIAPKAFEEIGRLFSSAMDTLEYQREHGMIEDNFYYNEVAMFKAHFDEASDRYFAQDEMNVEGVLRQQELRLEQAGEIQPEAMEGYCETCWGKGCWECDEQKHDEYFLEDELEHESIKPFMHPRLLEHAVGCSFFYRGNCSCGKNDARESWEDRGWIEGRE